MGVTSAAEWSAALIAGGRAADTPVAIVRRCTWADQETFRSTLATVAEAVAAQKIRPPAIFVVGEVVNLAPAISWFAARPLCGVRVLVTRPGEQVHDLRDRLAALGAEVLAEPGIEIGPPAGLGPGRCGPWAAGPLRLAGLFQRQRRPLSAGSAAGPGGRSAAAGRAEIGGHRSRHGRRVGRLSPQGRPGAGQYRAEALAESLLHVGAPGNRFLLARADRGRQVLPERLAAAGAAVDQIVVYSTVEATHADAEVLAALEEGRIDWVTVTSSAIARSLAALFGRGLGRSRLASISPVTSAVLRGLGYQPSAEAAEYTMAGLVAAIVAAEGEGGRR